MRLHNFKSTLVALSLLPLSQISAFDFETGGVYYNITDNTAKTVSVSSSPADALYSGVVTIPATVKNGGNTYTVTSIESEAFKNCIHLTGVNIGSEVTTIKYHAFYGCDALKEIVIPNNVASLPRRSNASYEAYSEAFANCTSLESVTIGKRVATMGTGVFKGCTSLKSVTIKDGCSVIGDECFSGCSKLPAIDIPSSVATIGYSAFLDCVALNTIVIPDGTTTIGSSAFQGCTAMTTATIGNDVESIGAQAFYGCIKLHNVTMGENLRTIYYRAFMNCTDLEEIVIPDYVVSIPRRSNASYEAYSEAFANCTALTTVTLGKRIAEMGTSVFAGCNNIKVINVKDGCSLIGETCFKDSKDIETINMECNDVPAVSDNSFANYVATLYVPTASLESYKAHEVWSKFLIKDYTGIGTLVDDGLTINTKDGVLVVSGVKDGTPISIYTTDGKLVNRVDRDTHVMLRPNTTYIIKVKGRTFKVMR